MLKMDTVSLKPPSPFRCHLIIASMFGQQKGLGQGVIMVPGESRGLGLEIGYFEENERGGIRLLISSLKEAFDNPAAALHTFRRTSIKTVTPPVGPAPATFLLP